MTLAALLEACLLAFVLAAGLAAGSLGVLMFGHLLGETWLRPVRAPLEAGARLVPLAALLAVPVLLNLDQLYPWAAGGASIEADPRAWWLEPGFFLLRAAAILALWGGLAFLIGRPGRHRRLSAVGLALLVPSASIAAQDWVMSRDPSWFGSLQGLALFVEQLGLALAAAGLVTLHRRGLPDRPRALGMERAVLTLAVATMWLWFLQFVVAWAADLPDEAAWYLRRHGGWAWLMLGLLVPTLAAAIALGALPGTSTWRLALACALLAGQHPGHLLWLLRPDAPRLDSATWLDAAAVAAVALAWATVSLRARGPEPAPARA